VTKPNIKPGHPLPFLQSGIAQVTILVADMNNALTQAHSDGFNMIQDGSGSGLNGDGHYVYLEIEGFLGVMLELI
jgi:methylmalonyl-CoA/ethylmalonyl-CoA epimerase